MAVINQGLEKSGLTAAEASRRAFGNPYFVYGILKKGHVPSVDNFSKLCRVLGLEIHMQSPENLRLGGPEGETGLLTPAHLPELERTAHTLARLVAAAGGDPIPEDLRSALADPDGPGPCTSCRRTTWMADLRRRARVRSRSGSWP